MKLVLEVGGTAQESPPLQVGTGVVLITPPLDESFWSARVLVSDKQAVVAFPKFGTIGIGFQVEDEDWNTNLPYRCDAAEIYNHIAVNKGDDAITEADCIAAIRLLQEWARKEVNPNAKP